MATKKIKKPTAPSTFLSYHRKIMITIAQEVRKLEQEAYLAGFRAAIDCVLTAPVKARRKKKKS